MATAFFLFLLTLICDVPAFLDFKALYLEIFWSELSIFLFKIQGNGRD